MSEKKMSRKEKWENRYLELLEFQKENPGKFPSSKVNSPQKSLGEWCIWQKINKNKLSDEQVEKLSQAGFNWEFRQKNKSWEERYSELVDFKNNNSGKMPKAGKDFTQNSLAFWCRCQKHNKDKLTSERVDLLNKIEFVWDKRTAYKSWEQRLNEFAEFVNKNPGKMPSSKDKGEYKSLGEWCKWQKRMKNKMDPSRIEKLSQIGFVWVSPHKNKTWDERLNEFIEFARNNPGKMPSPKRKGEHKSLGEWCKWQKRNRRNLPQEKIEKLNNAGFKWNNDTLQFPD